MTVQCITCQHFSLRTSGRMALEGFGNCAHRGSHEHQSARYHRVCEEHTRLDDAAVAKRIEWMEAHR